MKTCKRFHCYLVNPLSHPGEGGGEGIESGNFLVLYPLILAFSLREKGCFFYAAMEYLCPVLL